MEIKICFLIFSGLTGEKIMGAFKGTISGAILAFLVGCGGWSGDSDRSEGGSGFNSGVSGTTVAKDLTEAELTTICESAGDYFAEQISAKQAQRFSCFFTGAMAANSGTTDEERVTLCQTAFDECLTQDPEPWEDNDCSGQTAEASCEATVNELEACIEESIAEFKTLLGEISCSKINDDPAPEPAPGPACQILEDKGCSR